MAHASLSGRIASLLCVLSVLLFGWVGATQAGAQREEELSVSLRTAMSVAVRDRSVPVLHFANAEDGHVWINEMSRRLAKRIPDRELRMELLKTVHYFSLRNRLDPQLVLGLIEVESGFRRYAVSSAGARGLMQVMPFWLRVLGGGEKHNLFDVRTNVIYGCVILRHYLDIEKGDYFRALGRYNGSLGRAEYPNMVLSAWKGRWGYSGPTG